MSSSLLLSSAPVRNFSNALMEDMADNFLVVHKDEDALFLAARSIQRSFPKAIVIEARDADIALRSASTGWLSAAVVSSAVGLDDFELVNALRHASPDLPILFLREAVKGVAPTPTGATHTLNEEYPHRIGPSLVQFLASSTERATRATG